MNVKPALLRGELRAGRGVVAVVTGVVHRHDGLGAQLVGRVVHGVHRLHAVVGARLDHDVLERPQRRPRRRYRHDVAGLQVRQDGRGLRRAEGLGQRQDVGLDLLVHLVVDLRVVLVVLDVLGDVDLVAADAALPVDPLPERRLRVGDRHPERLERALGEVGDGAQVDAALAGVDRLRARLVGDPEVDLDALLPRLGSGGFLGRQPGTAKATASGTASAATMLRRMVM